MHQFNSSVCSLLCILAAPSGLMIESLGGSWIVLSWQSNIAVESYNVAVSGGGTEVNYTVNGTEVNLNVTGLRGNTEYSLRVIAIGTNGETSSLSATITAVIAIPGRDFSIPKLIQCYFYYKKSLVARKVFCVT